MLNSSKETYVFDVATEAASSSGPSGVRDRAVACLWGVKIAQKCVASEKKNIRF